MNDNAEQSSALLDDGLALLDRLGQRVPADLKILASVAANLHERLYPQERSCIARAVDKRRDEFSTGRWLARRALSELDIPAQPIVCGTAREPIWPAGVVASITHSSRVCGLAFGLASDHRGVGLDLEIARFPDSSLADMVLTASEPPEYRSPDMLQLLFSAKESVYKAAYPSCRRFLEFRDVTIRLDLSRRVFSAIAETENGALARFEPGGGLFEIGNHGVATLFAIPSDTALERPV